MGNLIGVIDSAATLTTNLNNNVALQNTALNLLNGDTAVKQKLTVTGTSTFNDDITLATGKKLNGIDVATLSTNLGTLQTTVTGMNTAVSGDFTGKAITGATAVTASGAGTFGSVTTTGAGTYGSLKTSDIDINGNILSSTGKSFITTADATGIKFTNGLPVTDTKHAYQSIDSASGDILIASGTGKKVVIGATNSLLSSDPNDKVTIQNGDMRVKDLQANKLKVGMILNNWDNTLLDGTSLKFDKTTSLTKDLLTVPAVTASGVITSGSHVNNGALTNTGALKIGTSKWLINEVADATKGTRLCFGAEDTTGKATYWTCMNKDGNLERF